MKTVILTSCNNSVEAKLIQGNLANEGIDSIISNENYTSLYPNMNGAMGSGIQILVNEADAERALKVINANDRSVHCTSCNSADVTQQPKKNMLKVVGIMIISLFSSSAFGNVKQKYHCNNCGADFEI
ncbi:MAG TPA: DUF2007 domain-containing protein [Bacteroidales bacterium]|nr:DUF2007 domain-containing protein [Bacteroidales bacterium]